jgi:hypothetical protein
LLQNILLSLERAQTAPLPAQLQRRNRNKIKKHGRMTPFGKSFFFLKEQRKKKKKTEARKKNAEVRFISSPPLSQETF